MNSTVSAELRNLFNVYKVSGTKRVKIEATTNTLVSDQKFLTEVQTAFVPIINKSDFNIESHINHLLHALLGVCKNVELYKEVTETKMQFVLYGVLVSALLKYFPTIITTVEIDKFRSLYQSSIELLMLLPQTAKISKAGCLSCVGKSIKFLSWINKDKIIV